ncbi:LysR family transcriptional regulator [Azohydromonas caseinilytica]|uniref:LysR family transcriptional regulator n=1 Tax=Azohydromonas caseinilytica TaxID=2728836 RepID=A0A848FAS8_9BURK|nr:LysR family transcriptional regulator [Azohydromonas caseinilytica]NML16432.1 LysR family transcriptional regulator [Azohydromonas caseinilytica]
MKTEDLRAFDAVVRHGSISLAARELGLTQPATTRRIQNLEESLGVQLLDRSIKPPKPSTLGLRVHAQTRAALREIDALRDLVTTDAMPTGRLRLGLTHSMGASSLVELLQDMRTRFPEVQLQVATDWSARLVEAVQQGRLDAAAVFMPPSKLWPDTLSAQRLASTEVLVVAAKGRFARTSVRLKDVFDAGWILNPDGCGFRAALQRALSEQGLPFQLSLETHGSELQLGLVAAGLGLGFVSRPALQASRHAEALDVMTLRDFSLALDVWLVSPTSQGNLQRAIEHFGAALGRGMGTDAQGTTARSGRRTKK